MIVSQKRTKTDMKQADLIIEIIDVVQIMSTELGQRVEEHWKKIAAQQGPNPGEYQFDLGEYRAAYIAYGGLIALHDLMEVIHESIKANDQTK